MSSIQDTLFHMDGVTAANAKDFSKALSLFQQVQAPSSAVMFNIGMCHMHLKNYKEAETIFEECTIKDKYFAIAHFQLAVALTSMQNYRDAIQKMENSLQAMRGNSAIDYKQLGMKYKFFACDVQMDLGVLNLFNGDYSKATECLEKAVVLPRDEHKHFYINTALEALCNQNWSYFGDDVFHRLITVPFTCFFYPSKAKMDGLKSDSKFRANAKVVSATDDTYSFVGFVGARKLQTERMREESDLTVVSSTVSEAPPPLPTMAPPRKLSGNLRSPKISPPKSPPPMPKLPPPAPNKPPPLSAKPKSNGSPPLPSKGISNELQNVLNQKARSKSPLPRPPPPSLQTSPHYLKCNLTLKFSISKQNTSSYKDFLEALTNTFADLQSEINQNPDNLKISGDSTGSVTSINKNSWPDVFLKAAREKSLCLSLDMEKAPPPPIPIKPKAAKPAYPIKPPQGPKDDNFDEGEGLYVDAGFHRNLPEEDLYTASVLPRS